MPSDRSTPPNLPSSSPGTSAAPPADWLNLPAGLPTGGSGSSGGPKYRVVLIDDQPIFRHGAASILTATRDFQVVGELADAKSALQALAAGPVDLLFTEAALADATLVKFLGRVRQEYRLVKVVVLTSKANRAVFQQALQLGASGFLLKRSTALELVTAARAVAANGIYIDPYVARAMVTPGGSRQAMLDGPARGGAASARELEVLRLFVLGHTNKEIATQLAISVKTVENHKFRGMKKLGLRTRAEVVRHVMLDWQSEPSNVLPSI